MQRDRKITIIVSAFIVLFVFIMIAIIYEYVVLNNLTQQLEEKRENCETIKIETDKLLAQIEEVESNEYIEKWAKWHKFDLAIFDKKAYNILD